MKNQTVGTIINHPPKQRQRRNHTNRVSGHNHNNVDISRSNNFTSKQRRNPKKFPKRGR